jgi:hypothetical protein
VALKRAEPSLYRLSQSARCIARSARPLRGTVVCEEGRDRRDTPSQRGHALAGIPRQHCARSRWLLSPEGHTNCHLLRPQQDTGYPSLTAQAHKHLRAAVPETRSVLQRHCPQGGPLAPVVRFGQGLSLERQPMPPYLPSVAEPMTPSQDDLGPGRFLGSLQRWQSARRCAQEHTSLYPA